MKNQLKLSEFWSAILFFQNDTEWEAELEGELNEYEMVGEDGEAVDVEDNPEWENQIQEMLEAESKKS